MKKNKRAEKYWFLPKRVNVHQMISIIKSIKDRGYDGTVWNDKKQDDISLDLKRLGSTRSGNKISNQGVRTLLASLNYLGFTYLDSTKTPSTINITKAGEELYNENKDKLVKIDNLQSDNTIDESQLFRFQFAKLQITNPSILKDCQNIFVFPFIATISLLCELEYLDIEEIALFVFKMENMLEKALVTQEIKNFRKLDKIDRFNLVEAFKKTCIGNIALVDAPSTGYFIRLCVSTGLMEDYYNILPDGSKKRALRIKANNKNDVLKLLSDFNLNRVYDFGDDLNLWIEYIGNTERLLTPVDIKICNNTKEEVYIEFFNSENKFLDSAILYPIKFKEKEKIGGMLSNCNEAADINICYETSEDNYCIFKHPVFIGETYTYKTYRVDDGEIIESFTFKADKNQIFVLKGNIKHEKSIVQMDKNNLQKEIINHIESNNFSGTMERKLNIIKYRLGEDKFNNKSLRGAVLEYYFYLLLYRLSLDGLIDEVVWNGKLGKYTLPTAAPGGKNGTPDIVFIINNKRYILELTTIKSKSQQQSSEVPSVIDHIRVYKRNYPKINIRGIFAAPKIYERNHSIMSQVASNENIEFQSLDIYKLLDILVNSANKSEIQKKLNSIFTNV